MPGSFQRFADLEAEAREVFAFEYGIIPGLLQCDAYMDAIFEAAEGVWWERDDSTREHRMRFRRQRQHNTWNSTELKAFHYIVGEAALDDLVGSIHVKKEQLRHILNIIDCRDNVKIQLLQSRTPNNPARGTGFRVLGFGSTLPRVAFLSVPYGPSVYNEEEAQVAKVLRVFDRLSHLALSPRDTRVAIARKLEEIK